MSGTATGTAGRWLLVVAGVAVAGAIVAAFFVMDPPARQRAERLDAIRVSDLQRLEERIESHAEVHGRLPERLSVVAGAPGDAIVDPATGRPYQFEVTGERGYRLRNRDGGVARSCTVPRPLAAPCGPPVLRPGAGDRRGLTPRHPRARAVVPGVAQAPTRSRTACMSRIGRTSTHPVCTQGNSEAMRTASSMLSASMML